MTLTLSRDKLLAYSQLMRLEKPIGSLLLLWPTLSALWIAAGGVPAWHLIAIFSLGTVLMRSAGCVINDYADRHFDGAVERTRQRPFARGAVSEKEALWLAAGLAFAAFLLILPLNAATWLASLPAVFLAVTYPFTKRFFPIPQLYLGLAYGFGIPMAFAATLGHVPLEGWWLFGASAFWTLAYDTWYAIVDKPDDLKLGTIKTSAITFGRYDVAMTMLCHAIHLGLLAALGVHLGRGVWFYAGLVAAAVLVAEQFRIARGRDRAACFKAFLDNNRVGLAIFAGLALDYGLA